MSPAPIHLFVAVEACRATVTLNAVRLFELDGSTQPRFFAPPINHYLIGPGNRLEIELSPALDDRGEARVTRLSAAHFEATVARYAAGDPVIDAYSGELLAEVIVPEAMAASDPELPAYLRVDFDTDGDAARRLLVDGDLIADAHEVVDYALRLRDLLAAGDAAALAAELAPKMRAYSEAFDEVVDEDLPGLQGFLRSEVLALDPDTAFERDDLVAEPSAGGRVWSVRRTTGEPLIVTQRPDADGAFTQIDVWVGRAGGALKVVR